MKNDLSVSYFTYKDEYWSIYYVKPYARIPVFLIGILAGCSFFSFKHEEPETQRIAKILEALKFSRLRAILSHIIGIIIMILMTFFLQLINNSPNNSSIITNVIYLLMGRPLFITGFSLMVFPIIVRSPAFKAVRELLGHNFWTPFSRLSYGAFLSHGIFM